MCKYIVYHPNKDEIYFIQYLSGLKKKKESYFVNV